MRNSNQFVASRGTQSHDAAARLSNTVLPLGQGTGVNADVACELAEISHKRIFISAAAVDHRDRYVQQSQINRQLTAVVIPVVEHDRSEHPDAGDGECFFPVERQTPVPDGIGFADPAQVLTTALLQRSMFTIITCSRNVNTVI
jgi:hypothetical protein